MIDKVATYPADTPDWAIADMLNAPDGGLPLKTVDIKAAGPIRIQSFLLRG